MTIDQLTELGSLYGTDKVKSGFCGFYHGLLAGSRESVAKVLEIGVLRGASLRMWRDYFPNATVHGLELERTGFANEERMVVHQGDQASRPSLNRLIARIGTGFDLIVDDGGHTMEQQQVSLAALFPHVRPGGLYVIEDLPTSFSEWIIWRDKTGKEVARIPTGAKEEGMTTYEVLKALRKQRRPESLYLSAAEIDGLCRDVATVEIFDRDGDRAFMTSAIRKKTA